MQPPVRPARRPWAIVTLGFLLMFVVFAPNINLVGLFVAPMAEDFGVSRTNIALIATVFTFSSTITYLFAGKVLGKYKMNLIMAAALVVLAAAHFATTYTASMPLLYTLSAIKGVCNSLLTVVPISIAINGWFSANKNGRALGIAMAGSGAGALLLNPVTGYIMESVGWRWGYRLYGVLALALLPPVLAMFKLPAKDEAKPLPERGWKTESPPEKRGAGSAQGSQAVFLLLFFAYLLVASTTQSFNVNGASFLGDSGFATQTAANILALMSFGLILGKVGLGIICDKLGAKVGNWLSINSITLGYVLFILSTRFALVAVPAALFMGFGMATNTIVQPLTAASLFHKSRYGVLVSHLQLGTNIGSGLFPLVTSAIYEATGSYLPGWYMLCGMLVAALCLVLLAWRLNGRQGA